MLATILSLVVLLLYVCPTVVIEDHQTIVAILSYVALVSYVCTTYLLYLILVKSGFLRWEE